MGKGLPCPALSRHELQEGGAQDKAELPQLLIRQAPNTHSDTSQGLWTFYPKDELKKFVFLKQELDGR